MTIVVENATGNPAGCYAIVVSAYNSNITFRMRDGAIESLRAAGIADAQIVVVTVPGAWELPLAAARLIGLPATTAVIALGAVIKGETTHDQHINRAVSNALMDMMIKSGKPVGFGLLTCNTLEQAIHRAGGNVGNKGCEAADAVLEMVRLQRALEQVKLS